MVIDERSNTKPLTQLTRFLRRVTTRVPNPIAMARQLTSIGLLGAAIIALYGVALINSFGAKG
jgi:hypothetical protein